MHVLRLQESGGGDVHCEIIFTPLLPPPPPPFGSHFSNMIDIWFSVIDKEGNSLMMIIMEMVVEVVAVVVMMMMILMMIGAAIMMTMVMIELDDFWKLAVHTFFTSEFSSVARNV